MTGRPLQGIGALALIVALGGCHKHVAAVPEKDVATLVAKVRAAYATCKTYQDSGTQTTVFGDEPKSHSEDKTIGFSTLYIRPGWIRFEYKSTMGSFVTTEGFCSTGRREDQEHLVESGDGWTTRTQQEWTATTWDQLGHGAREDSNKPEPLDLSVARITGTSGGLSHVISKLLFPDDISGRDFLAAKDFQIVGAEEVSGEPCTKVESKSQHSTYWFDNNTHLLRKVVEVNDYPNPMDSTKSFHSTDTTLYSPEVNGAVHVDQFRH